MSATRADERLGVQPWARAFVGALLGMLVVCGLAGIEAWPFSGFRLFSGVRGPVTSTWRLVAVTSDGEEVPINVSRLGPAYRGFGHVAREFGTLEPAERAAVCEVWLRAAESIGIDAVALRFVRFDQPLVPRDDDGPLAAPRREVVDGCPEPPP